MLAEGKLNKYYDNASCAQQPMLWAQYNGAREILIAMGYGVTRIGARHKVTAYADTQTG